MTVTGKTVGENLKGFPVLDRDVIRSLDQPYHSEGGIAILYGNLAPEGGVVKQSAVAPEMLQRTAVHGSSRASRMRQPPFSMGLSSPETWS